MGKIAIYLRKFLLLAILGLCTISVFLMEKPVYGNDTITEEPDYSLISQKIANSGTQGYINDVDYSIDGKGYLCSNNGETVLYQNIVTAFALYNNTLFVAVENGSKTEIISLSSDGTPRENFLSVKGKIKSFSIKDGILYYLLDNTIYDQRGKVVYTQNGILGFSLNHNGSMNITTTDGYYQYQEDSKALTKLTEYSSPEESPFQTRATVYNPRLTAPTSGNQYYFSNKNIFYAAGFGMPNCTAYAYGRAYEILGTAPKLCTGNAGKWFDYNKNGGYYSYGSTPKLGAIAVWANDSSHNQGHVAVVERINSNGSITISESYYGSTFFKTQTANINSMYTSKTFLGFIYILSDGVESNVVTEPTLSATDVAGGKSISLSCGTSGAAIYYTTDGSTPTTASKKYTGPFTIKAYTTIKAVGVKAGSSNSSIMTKSINISSVSAPTASVASGSLVATNDKVYLSCATPGATIYYTTDGSTPTTSSMKYSDGIVISKSMTIKAIGEKTGLISSTVSTFQYANWTTPFTDLKGNEWYFNDVADAYDNGYISGVGNNRFAPNDTTTRAMFVTILSRLDATHNISNYEVEFSDVAKAQWYSDPIGWAYANDIVNGIGGNKFAPSSPITREQACVIMVNYAKYRGIVLSSNNNKINFSDAKSISGYAENAVTVAQQAGLINGRNNNTFDPKGRATRAEITAIIMRMVRLYL